MHTQKEIEPEDNGTMTVGEFLFANTNEYGPPLYVQFVVQGTNGHALWDGDAGDRCCPENIKVMEVVSWRIMQDQQDVDTILVWIKANQVLNEDSGCLLQLPDGDGNTEGDKRRMHT